MKNSKPLRMLLNGYVYCFAVWLGFIQDIEVNGRDFHLTNLLGD